jgi:gliding motility-associated protein GldM
MAGGKLSPRQKMINMMYLVLMALLALNVSKEILKTFHLMEVSFNKSKENLEAQIDVTIAGLKDKVTNKPGMKPYLEAAQEADKIGDKFVADIQEIMDKVLEGADGRKEEDEHKGPDYELEVKTADNIEEHANLFMVENGGKLGKELPDMINKAREDIIAQVAKFDKEVAKEIDGSSALRATLTDADKKKYKDGGWTAKYLEHSPAAGVVALLTKIQNDARATQLAVIEQLAGGEKTTFVVKQLVPVVKTTTPAVLVGQEYKAEVFLAAITDQSGDNEFELAEGASGKLEREGDKAIFSLTPTNQGEFTFKGVIKVPTEDSVANYTFESTFQAFKGQASISATAMNMLYIGIPNPMSIAVPGVAPDKISVSMSGGGGRISKTGNGYQVTVSQPGNATISVTAELSDGTRKNVGQMVFRVRRLPKPEAKWGTLDNDGLPKPRMAAAAQSRVLASMGEGFAFEDVKYNITRYQFIYQPRRGDARVQRITGSAIPGSVKGLIQKGSKGDRILVDQIRASGPGGERPLSPIIIELL